MTTKPSGPLFHFVISGVSFTKVIFVNHEHRDQKSFRYNQKIRYIRLGYNGNSLYKYMRGLRKRKSLVYIQE